MLRTPAPPSTSWHRRLLSVVLGLTVGLLGLLVPLVAATPANAVEPPELCVGPLECVRIATGYNNDANLGTSRLYDIEPVREEPANEGFVPWQGTFRLVDSESRTSTPKCLEVVHTGLADLAFMERRTCSDDSDQRWYAEPVGDSLVTDPASPNRFNPWRTIEQSTWTIADHQRTKFLLRSAGADGKDRCIAGDGNKLDDTLATGCPTSPTGHNDQRGMEINLLDAPLSNGYRKSAAEKQAVTDQLIGSMVEHAMEQCRTDRNYCSVQLLDANNGGTVLTAPSRIDNVTIDAQPVPILDGSGCAGGGQGGSVQRIFNAGLDPMETSISVGGESAFENSVTHGFGVEVTAGISAFVESSVTVSTTHEWGKTWSTSTSFDQTVNWTVPPQRYATAVLSTASIKASSKWRFGLSNPNRNSRHTSWATDEIVDMKIPYADSADASGPDSTMTVYNSVDKKSCSAKSPSRLDDDAPLLLTNETLPGAAPVVGDELRVHADPAEFLLSATDTSPVNLAYRWYRVRAGEEPQLIQRANRATYTVTSDDVAGDDDETETMGRYRVYATVTDVADQFRFDSPEYSTLRTAAVSTERPQSTVGPTELTARVLNPHVAAGDPVRVEFTATAENATAPASGEVVVRVDGIEQAPVPLVDGTALFTAVLPAGQHQLDAEFLPDVAEYTGARTEPFGVTVTGRDSRTTLTTSATSVERGNPVTLTAKVAPVGGGSHVPTGEVEFTAGGRSLGNPVEVDATGTATLTITLPRGEHTVTAQYAGDDLFAGSTSTARSVTVERSTSSVVLVAEETQVLAGSPLPLSASVTAGGQPVTDGTVQLFVDGRTHGDPIPVSALGTASWQANGLALGGHRLVLRYAPANDDVSPATSGTVDVEVTRTATSLALTTSVNRARAGVDVPFRAVVTNGAGDPVTSGTVQLVVDGVPFGRAMTPDAHGTVDFKVSTMKPGSRQVSARYVPSVPGLDASVAATLGVVVEQALTQVALTTSKQVHGTHETVVVRTAVTRRDGTTPSRGNVRLFVDGKPFGPARSVSAAGTARWQVTDLPVGKRRLMVRYTPAASDGLLDSVSRTLVHRVRAFGASISASVAPGKVKAKPGKRKALVTGRLRFTGPGAPAATGRTVRVLRGDRVVGTARTDARGRFTVTVRRGALKKGINRLTVEFRGSTRPSAGSDSTTVTLRKR